MTTLLAYLTAHHMHHVVTVPTSHAYHSIHAYCTHRGQLTGWAQYGRRVVAYCYPKGL